MKLNKIYVPFLLAIAVVLGIYMGKKLNFATQPVELAQQDIREQKLRQLINYIDYEYVDDVNTDSLLDLTISDLLHKLDPHSTYIAKQDVERSEENLRGSFEGIGIEYRMRNDSLTVLRTISGGPSEKAGLKGGDRIVKIEGEAVAGNEVSEEKYRDLLRGKSGSIVKVEVYRPVENKLFDFEITRGTVPLYSVNLSYMLNDTVGLIKVERFSQTTADEFDSALNKLIEKGMKGLVLDLRDNPGGLLSAAVSMSDHFLKKKELIVYTKERDDEYDYTYATRKGKFESGKVVVLINENSASASEIVAGALQDNDRATIVGRRSFGKGLVQEEMQLKDGSKLRLTTARYYTPTGRSIQKPYENGYEDYKNEAKKRIENGELIEADSIKIEQSEKFVTPGGKVVYGGGGIVPDIFVPIDTSGKALGMLYHYFGFGPLAEYAFLYVDAHRKSLNQMSWQSFLDDFEVSDTMIVEAAAISKLPEERLANLNEHSKQIVKSRMKALIARNIWGAQGLFGVLYQTDPMVKRAETEFGPAPLAQSNVKSVEE